MAYRVAPGHGLTVNGRELTEGAEFPDLGDQATMQQLEAAGLIVADMPARKADKRGAEE
jgi:hypothetical protein